MIYMNSEFEIVDDATYQINIPRTEYCIPKFFINKGNLQESEILIKLNLYYYYE